jgi:hypothetical protein
MFDEIEEAMCEHLGLGTTYVVGWGLSVWCVWVCVLFSVL